MAVVKKSIGVKIDYFSGEMYCTTAECLIK